MNPLQKLSISFILATGLLLAHVPDQLHAQPGGERGGNFGLGVMFGEPTGISIKSWTGSRSAFGLGAAWSLSGRNEAIHLHLDWLTHTWFHESDTGRMSYYYGIGGRIIFADDATAGVRIPIGLNYVFRNLPFDLFAEAVPIVDLTPDTDFAGNGAVGIRYYF